jgi:hypothetical protein
MSEKNPWISIWVEPRSTIRKIVLENPNQSIWPLGFIYGFLSLLNSFQSVAIGTMMGMVPVFIIALIIAPFWGYAAFSIWSWVVCRIGKWLKGEGDFRAVRAAFAWSCVPLVVNICLWFLMILFFGAAFFFHSQDVYPISTQQTSLLFLILIAKVVVAVWSLVIYLNALAEVQNFSILRAIFNVIISWIVVGVILGALWFALMYVLQMGTDSGKLSSQLWESGVTLQFLRTVL